MGQKNRKRNRIENIHKATESELLSDLDRLAEKRCQASWEEVVTMPSMRRWPADVLAVFNRIHYIGFMAGFEQGGKAGMLIASNSEGVPH